MLDLLPNDIITNHILTYLFKLNDIIEFRMINRKYNKLAQPILDKHQALRHLIRTLDNIDIELSIKLDEAIIKEYRLGLRSDEFIERFMITSEFMVLNELYQFKHPSSNKIFENDVFFPNYSLACLKTIEKIVFINNNGFNIDSKVHRIRTGTPQERNVLEFDWLFNKIIHVLINKDLTWKDILKALMHVKSCKFDYRHELYCGINKYILRNNILYIYLLFDHGS